jgi:glycerophosphoryl diester phosphodiesterase
MVINCAHRGFSGKYPDNSMLAYEKAIEAGAEMIEIDVHRTKDNQIVIHHDAQLLKNTGKKGSIVELTYEEILTYNLPKNQKIPLLSQLLDLLKPTPVKLNIEIKAFECEELILQLVKEREISDQIVYSSFLAPTLMELHDLDPSAVLCSLSGSFKPKHLENYINQAKLTHSKYMNMHYKTLTPEAIEAVHKAGYEIMAWTVNSPREMKRLMKLGVESIITNYPDKLAKLKQ